MLKIPKLKQGFYKPYLFKRLWQHRHSKCFQHLFKETTWWSELFLFAQKSLYRYFSLIKWIRFEDQKIIKFKRSIQFLPYSTTLHFFYYRSALFFCWFKTNNKNGICQNYKRNLYSFQKKVVINLDK